jgi:hypothetical protein
MEAVCLSETVLSAYNIAQRYSWKTNINTFPLWETRTSYFLFFISSFVSFPFCLLIFLTSLFIIVILYEGDTERQRQFFALKLKYILCW